MHILVIVHDFRLGGAERIALRLGSEWARTGEDVTVLCGKEEGPLQSLLGAGVRVRAANPPIRRSRRSRLDLGKAATRLIREDRPDIIFLPGNYYFNVAVALKARLRGRCPPIVGKISNTLRRRDKSLPGQAAYLARFWLKSLFVDHIVAMSPSLLAEARHIVPGGAGKFSTIAQPVLEPSQDQTVQSRELPIRVGGSTTKLIAAGRLTPQKNFRLLIDAFARVRGQCDATLDIFGDGPLHADLQAHIKELQLANRVRLRGYVSSLQEHLPAYDLFVLSSDFEGFPSVLVEARAAGLPVVTTDCTPAIRDLVPDNRPGRVVPVGDVEALAEAMIEAIRRGSHNPELIGRGTEHYELGSSARSYVALFRRISGSRAAD